MPCGKLLLLLVALQLFSASPQMAQEKTTYQDQILPLIEANCAKCHNADKKKADLDLTSYAGALKGSGSGPIVLSGNPDGSKLWKALNHAEEPFMPPNRPKLGDKELDVFKKWIVGGLLENPSGKVVAAAKSGLDLALSPDTLAKPEGPAPMPLELPFEPVVHTAHGTAITGLAASPWAPLIAVAGQKQVLVFNTDTLELLGILPFVEGQPQDLKFSRNGKLLLAAGGRGARSGRVVLWDVVTGEHLATLGEEFDSILAADIRPDQSQIAFGGPTRLVKILSIKTAAVQHKLKKHTDWVTAVAFSPNGQMLATADRNGGISIWDPDSAQELFTLAGHKAAVTALSWRPDSKLLASSSEDGTVKLWEMQEGKQAKSWTAHSSGALCVCYAADGHLVTCGRDHVVTLWEGTGGKPRHCQFFGNIAIRAAFSHDGKRIFATDFDGRVAAWSADDQKKIGELNPDPPLLADQIAAARKRLAEVQSKADAAQKDVNAAELEVTRTSAALEAARKAVETAAAEQKNVQAELAKLAAPSTNSPPDLQAKLLAATNACKTAEAKVASTTGELKSKEKEVETAKAKLAQAKADCPNAALAEATAALKKMQAAHLLSSVYHAREDVHAREREHANLAALVEANAKALKKAEKELADAKAAEAAASARIQATKPELDRNGAAARAAEAEFKAQQARLDQLLHDYRAATADPPPDSRQAAK